MRLNYSSMTGVPNDLRVYQIEYRVEEEFSEWEGKFQPVYRAVKIRKVPGPAFIGNIVRHYGHELHHDGRPVFRQITDEAKFNGNPDINVFNVRGFFIHRRAVYHRSNEPPFDRDLSNKYRLMYLALKPGKVLRRKFLVAVYRQEGIKIQ